MHKEDEDLFTVVNPNLPAALQTIQLIGKANKAGLVSEEEVHSLFAHPMVAPVMSSFNQTDQSFRCFDKYQEWITCMNNVRSSVKLRNSMPFEDLKVHSRKQCHKHRFDIKEVCGNHDVSFFHLHAC